MAIISQEECKRQLKANELARLYVVCGRESYLKQHYAMQLAQAAVEETLRDFNFHRFEGNVDLDTLVQAVEAVPLGSERSCVLVRDFPLESMATDKDFLNFLAELPQHVVLIFWQDTAEFKPKKSKPLLAAISAGGFAVELNAPDAAQVLRLVAAGVKARGCAIDRPTAEYFVQAVGSELNLLQNELDKLCAYAAGAITRAHIDEVCIKSVDAKSFDMVKAVAAGNGGAALALLEELFTQRVAPQMLLGSLVANYVDIFRACMALCSGKRADDPAKLFDYKGKAFRLQNAGRMAAKMKPEQIKHSLALLAQADRRLKNSSMDNRLVMEQCVIGLLKARS